MTATIELPTVDPYFAPIIYALPVQFLAYYGAESGVVTESAKLIRLPSPPTLARTPRPDKAREP